MPVKKPCRAAVLIALIPFVAMCFSVGLWDRINPTFLGIPFNLVWLVSWMILTSLCMSIAYRVDTRRRDKGPGE
jgi:hypothetical protein